MSANDLWNPMRVENFMRELKLVPTEWDENIVAIAEKGSMSVEEFLKTDPITFGEKMWGKDDWKYTNGYPRVLKILGDSTYREMLYYYQNTPAQLAAKAFMDAKVAAIKEQKALGRTTYMGVSAENKAGWEYVFAENKAAKAAAEKAAEQAKIAKEAVEAVTAGWARQAAEDRAFAYQQVAAWEAMDARAAPAEPKKHIVFNPEDEEVEEDEEAKKTEWTCETCTAVWRTKTKTH